MNALLDDASTRTYLNADVAAELGLQGHCQRVTVNVLNGRAETFETAPVELEVESLDGKISKKINAFTTDRVTGSLRIIDWAKESEKWKHLQGIQFPKQSSARPIVDILIGIDCLDLHYSYEDVQAYQESQSREERLLAGLASELQTAVQDDAFKLISFTLTLFERNRRWRKLTQLSVSSGR